MTAQPTSPLTAPMTASVTAQLTAQATAQEQLQGFLQAQRDPALAADLFSRGSAAITHYGRGTIAARADALRAAYPTVVLLLGDEGFSALAGGFCRATPARHWDLNAYGAELPAWIGSRQADDDGAKLADVARLDWAMHRAAFAADCAPLDREALATVDESHQPLLRLLPHSATALVASPRPVASLWRGARDDALQVPDGEAETVLVGRDTDGRVWLRKLSAGEAAFIHGMLAGQGLGDALAAALSAEAGFDLSAALPRQFEDRVWCGFEIGTL